MGVSFDAPARNGQFAEANAFPFPLWTDVQKELALYYGAASTPAAFVADRRTVVLDAAGRWLLTYTPFLDLGGHAGRVLEDCEAIFGRAR